jgi:hypothetical protein
VSRVDVVFDREDNLYFFYPTSGGFRYFAASEDNRWRRWSGPRALTGPDVTGRDASKHDRRRWRQEGVLSFTVRTGSNGFAILDAGPGREP